MEPRAEWPLHNSLICTWWKKSLVLWLDIPQNNIKALKIVKGCSFLEKDDATQPTAADRNVF